MIFAQTQQLHHGEPVSHRTHLLMDWFSVSAHRKHCSQCDARLSPEIYMRATGYVKDLLDEGPCPSVQTASNIYQVFFYYCLRKNKTKHLYVSILAHRTSVLRLLLLKKIVKAEEKTLKPGDAFKPVPESDFLLLVLVSYVLQVVLVSPINVWTHTRLSKLF